jgi:copper(I)-binding protein
VPQPTTPGTTVAYLDIRNNGRADRLISATTSVGGTVQLRAPVARHGSILTMHTVPYIALPADSMTHFNPDTEHLLITGAGPMHDGKDIFLRLKFANAGTVTVLVPRRWGAVTPPAGLLRPRWVPAAACGRC